MLELLNQLEECKKSSKTGPSAAASQNHIMFVSTFLKSSTQSIPTPFVLNTALYSIFTMICGKFLLPLRYDTSIWSPEEGFKNEIELTAQTNGLSAWPLSLIFVTFHRHLVTDKRNTQIQIYKYTHIQIHQLSSLTSVPFHRPLVTEVRKGRWDLVSVRPAWLESSGDRVSCYQESFRMDAVAKTTIIMFCLSQKNDDNGDG